MTAEITPAVQRAARALETNYDMGPIMARREAIAVLNVALDVEEMARVLHDESEFADTWEQESQACRNQYLSDARALRASILGAES